MVILDDENAETLDPPSEYGVDDLPMIVQDRAFDGDNQFDDSAPFLSNRGVLGDEILVNGTRGPFVDVTTRLVRLRLLNASNARLYNVGFADDRPFQLIATDGGLLREAWETNRLHLSPGERAEIVAAFTPGETVELRSHPAEFGFTGMSGRDINGEKMDPRRIDFAVRDGTTEIWEVTNTDGYMHNTDPNLPYMYYCHLPLHEDEGMMGQPVVLGDGEEIGEIPSSHDHP